ncbi:DUF3562 domain-containing protein [Burkholderia pseudomultivorans]|uniref:DUF3562 domain-containing protein n=1 Tax=Burkholderia pseudomultivorans TaxID=1207504 RepID=A0A132END7_9BURK|nr:DUF3562 domain-containing protein [Burkholderia pseudomultivorans]KWF38023.1 hypothetical protein WT56_04900 [Burkholderia pseudomultivorans]MDR8727954.1 hypothetical protein [Burkholderia pseudomultivorans]MDR8734065.1 hypothetical protein [Burkholderia pseudomultivorans]MDR8743709.1 hypothetical protein [Burkholderia pseudomultivorans]MDR8757826.1 hypothetical protein [Burkholderia pseudomultivorans]
MAQDNLLDSLKEVAERREIGAEQLRAMLDDEVRVLSDGARVHDYIHVFAIRHLRDRMRQQAEADRDPSPGASRPDESGSRASAGL